MARCADCQYAGIPLDAEPCDLCDGEVAFVKAVTFADKALDAGRFADAMVDVMRKRWAHDLVKRDA